MKTRTKDGTSDAGARDTTPAHPEAVAQFILRGALCQTEAARELGISNRTLSDWSAKGHAIWKPACAKPGFMLYPLRQVEYLQAIMLGAITEDEAWAQWSAVLNGIAAGVRRPA